MDMAAMLPEGRPGPSALSELPGRAGELALVALQLLVHRAPVRPGLSGAHRPPVEARDRLHLARGGGDPDLVRVPQLRRADWSRAPRDRPAARHLLDDAARRAGQDAL